MEIDITDFQGHEFAAPREGLIGDADVDITFLCHLISIVAVAEDFIRR